MKRVLVVALAVGLAAGPGRAMADDVARIGRETVLIGEQFQLTLEIETPPGSTVEVDPLAPSWAGVEVVRIASATEEPRGDVTIHRLDLVAAGFLPGTGFAPAVVVITPSGAVSRVLPGVALGVHSSLPGDAPLELSPLPGSRSTSGGESPLLRPSMYAGAAAVAALLVGLVLAVARRVLRRVRRTAKTFDEPAPESPGLEDAEGLIEFDPVRAYRLMGQTVRGEIARRYQLPAVALTTSEIGSRMEGAGVDRWIARLVAGLLQECDAVVYAGYRPAAERRLADLNMAREILEGSG